VGFHIKVSKCTIKIKKLPLQSASSTTNTGEKEVVIFTRRFSEEAFKTSLGATAWLNTVGFRPQAVTFQNGSQGGGDANTRETHTHTVCERKDGKEAVCVYHKVVMVANVSCVES